MKLLTQDVLKALPEHGSTIDQGKDAIAQVKFFCPWANWTWYAVEYSPKCKVFYGLVDGFEKEVGYWGLEELEEIAGPMGMTIERDLYFEPKTLRELMGESLW
jgi:hypothetical protein